MEWPRSPHLAFGQLLGPDVFATKATHELLTLRWMFAFVVVLFAREQVTPAEKECSDAERVLVFVRVQAGQLVALLGT